MTKNLMCIQNRKAYGKWFLIGDVSQLDIVKRLDGTITYVLNNNGWYEVTKQFIDENFI